jgi:uncharacterized phiE125 gp8 family phage protein
MTTILVSRNAEAELPVTLTDMAQHLKREDTEEDDEYIEACLLAAIDWAERFTGLCLVDSTFDQYFDNFPETGPIRLARGPLLEVQSVNYRDVGSAAAVLGTSGYGVSSSSLYLPANGVWPTTDGALNAVRIRYRAGFVDMTGSPLPDGDIPATIKAAIKLYAAMLYGNRDNELDMLNESRVPYGAELLLRLHRIDDSLA